MPARRNIRRKAARRPNKNLRNLIKSEIARNVENKSSQLYNNDIAMVSYNNPTFGSKVFPVSPYTGYVQIDQGVSQGQRIGNSIKIKSCHLRLLMNPKPYDATFNQTPEPMEIVMWLFYDKTNTTTIPNPTSDFIQLGGSSTYLQSKLIDTISTVNSDRWRVLMKKTFKLGYSNNTGLGISTSQPYAQNNDFKLNIKKTFNITKHLIKNVKFDDNDSAPTTRGLFCMFEAVPADGSTGGTSQEACEVSYSIDCRYEDA